ncbi:MAG: arginase family protein [Erythrobacter sp.]|nr:arginase family protein [Erythrobacter sp.]
MSVPNFMDAPAHDIERGNRGAEPALVIPDTLHVEQTDDTSATIYLSDTGARIRIPRKLFEVVLKLETPDNLASVSGGDQRIASALATLAERGFLVAPGTAANPATPRLSTDPSIRLFDCPARKDDGSLSDIAIFGVPYDYGDPGAAGARGGATALRELSLQLLYRTHRLTGRPLGWYDADGARDILSGISISDGGDARIDHGEPQATTFRRVSALIEDAIERGALPVVLGGDATVGLPVARSLAANRSIGVVQVCQKAARLAQRRTDFVSIASLTEAFGDLPGVEFVEEVSGDAAAATIFSNGRIAAPKKGLPVYLNLDMAAIQGGWDYPGTCSFIERLSATHPICGIGLLGLNPARQGWATAGMTALHLLMQAMDAATRNGELEKAA